MFKVKFNCVFVIVGVFFGELMDRNYIVNLNGWFGFFVSSFGFVFFFFDLDYGVEGFVGVFEVDSFEFFVLFEFGKWVYIVYDVVNWVFINGSFDELGLINMDDGNYDKYSFCFEGIGVRFGWVNFWVVYD